jgi:hypothetical protein
MKTDRELLELAAKAAGFLETASVQDGYGFTALRVMDADSDWAGKDWNPLTDDGDALRLAVKLEMRVECSEEAQVYVWHKGFLIWNDLAINKNNAKERESATRRAIVRAAAAIGEAK